MGFALSFFVQQVSSYRTDFQLAFTLELEFESEPSVEVALELFRNHAADFADCLHIALAHRAGHAPLWTFDKTAGKVVGAKILK